MRLSVAVIVLATLLGVVYATSDQTTTTGSGDATEVTVEQRQKCEACHLVMDTFYKQIMDLFIKKRRQTRGNVEIRGDSMIFTTCDEIGKQHGLYGPTAETMCRDFIGVFRPDILSIFNTQFEISDNVDAFYRLKYGLCEKIHIGCMRPQDKPRIDNCDACKLLMEDTERIFSWGHGRKNFASKEHLYRVLEELCPNLLVRHPIRYHHKLLELCGDLTEEHGTEIVAAVQHSFQSKGPAPARKVCIDIAQVCAREMDEL